MKHDRINILALLYADVQTKAAIYETADAGRDMWPTMSPAWFTASQVATDALNTKDSAVAILRHQCKRDNLSSDDLRGIADVIGGQ